jgi:hypothetical protein
MQDVWLSLTVVTGLALGSILAGRAFAAAWGVKLLQRWTPEALLMCACLGTGVWVLGFGCCSYLGLRALPAALVVVGVSAALMTVQLGRRWPFLPRGPRRWGTLAAALTPCVVAVAAALLPVGLGDCFTFQSDSMIYDSVAEWLQTHSFWAPVAPDPNHPGLGWVLSMQATGHRMGPMFLLAMVRAFCPGSLPIDLFPAVSAWGAALNVGGVYLLCRWAFRCGRAWSFVAAVAAAGVNPLAYAVACGFLCQLYGTGVLCYALAALTRLAPRGRWNARGAALFALPAALLVSVYSEMAPILFLAAVAHVAYGAGRAWRRSAGLRFMAFACGALGIFLLFANVEVLRALRSLSSGIQAKGVIQCQEWSDMHFWSFAVGARRYDAPAGGAAAAMATLCTCLLVVGVARSALARRALPVLASLLVFAVLAAYYRWVAHDPWTGALGYKWNLFKLCQWAFPLLLSFQGAGLARLGTLLLRRPLPSRLAAAAASAAVVAVAGWLHWVQAREAVALVHDDWHSRTPLSSLRLLQREVSWLGASSVYLCVDDGTKPYVGAVLAHVLGPRPFYNSWPTRHFFRTPTTAGDHVPSPPPGGMVCLALREDLPVDALAGAPLPCGLVALDLSRPGVIGMDDLEYPIVESEDGTPYATVGRGAVTVRVWASEGGAGVLTFLVGAGPSLPDAPTRRLLTWVDDGPEREVVAACGQPVATPVRVHAGVNRIHLRCTDEPSRPLPNGDPRVFLFTLSRCHFSADRPNSPTSAGDAGSP